MEVRARDGLGELVEEGLLDLGKLGRIHDLKDVLHLVEEHDFFRAIDLGPISEKSKNDLECGCKRKVPSAKRIRVGLEH